MERPNAGSAVGVSSVAMTDVAVPGPATSSAAPDTAAVCPYLLAPDAAWRLSKASREHRCHAVAPAALLTTEKQRRLCLVTEHTGCSTYIAAMASLQEATPRRAHTDHRPVTRTAPLVLDRGRVAVAVPGLPEVGVGQSGLVALMAVAFGALAVTRLGTGGPELRPAGAPGVESSPRATVEAPATLTPRPAASASQPPSRTLVPSDVESTSPPPAATPVTPEPTTAPSSAPRTYTVRGGDTLSGIAGEYGTTWQVLAELNELEDPRRLRVGQVLQLP